MKPLSFARLVIVRDFASREGAEIKVSPIPCCKQRGVNSLQDNRCLQSVGYYSFLCRFSPRPPSGIAAVI